MVTAVFPLLCHSLVYKKFTWSWKKFFLKELWRICGHLFELCLTSWFLSEARCCQSKPIRHRHEKVLEHLILVQSPVCSCLVCNASIMTSSAKQKFNINSSGCQKSTGKVTNTGYNLINVRHAAYWLLLQLKVHYATMLTNHTTPWATKKRHFTFVYIFANYWPIFKTLSLAHSADNLQ